MANWIEVCAPDNIEQEGAIRFTQGGKPYAVYRSPDDEVFCADGVCTHEHVDLTDGLVMDITIKCPKLASVFDNRTCEALRALVCVNLQTYPTRSENGHVLIEI
jgi:3-phenylpropionate/trans-cinnamate dioxygenase ferredoxin component